MSVENAQKFLERIKTDGGFRDSLSKASSFDERAKLVKAAGYDFTKAEMEQVHPAGSGGELSDEELESVSGGSASNVITDIAATISTAIALAG